MNTTLQIIRVTLTVILISASIIFFFLLILGGIKWITSGGDKGQTEVARNQITSALIGFVIMLSLFALTNLIGSLLRLSLM